MDVLILAAGVGSRLGSPYPKPLTRLKTGESILGRQIRLLDEFLSAPRVSIVVGFKKEMIMEEFPDRSYVYNERFGETNTSKSLLRGFHATGDSPTLWLNGDVVFEGGLLNAIAPLIAGNDSFVCVNRKQVGDEEIKYTLDEQSRIAEISKSVSKPLGEAIGINYVSSRDKGTMIHYLSDCEDGDYFEQAMENAIRDSELSIRAADIGSFEAIEVDFEEDLASADKFLE